MSGIRGRRKQSGESRCKACSVPLPGGDESGEELDLKENRKELGLCLRCHRFHFCEPIPLVSTGGYKSTQRVPEVRWSPEQIEQEKQRAIRFIGSISILAAKGDAVAQSALLEIADQSVSGMQSFPLESAIKIAARRTSWPVAADIKGNHDALLARLKLGAKLPRVYTGPCSEQATYMLMWLRLNQGVLELPQLSRQNESLWFETGWNGLLYATEGHPEDDSELRKLGKGAGYKPKYCGGLREATERSQVRAKIKSRLSDSFKKLARYLEQIPN